MELVSIKAINMKKPSISISGRKIGIDEPPYVIAELSANHNGKLDTALKIIEEAKRAGADAIKLQTYTADTITLNSQSADFQIQGGLWDGRSLYELYQQAHMPWEWHAPLFEYARKLDITIFSSPFDRSAVDLLESLNAPAYKIASFEAVDLPLIRYVASTGKPMIISTGMADAEEIQEAISAAYEGGCKQLAILHCVSGYPAPAEDYNLRTIPDMMQRFGLVTGLSDHTLDNTTAIASVALGASIIEKHFTLDRNGGGPDDSFSLEPTEMFALCRDSKTAWSALGRVDYGRKSSEQGNLQFRRSLYFVQSLKKGEVITDSSIRSVRPGFGLAPKYFDKIIGCRMACDVEINSSVTEDCLDLPHGFFE
ncbi:Pseudaminic acid synthase [compost metagenome]